MYGIYMKFTLPLEFKIACEIYRCNKKDINCTTKYLLSFFGNAYDNKIIMDTIYRLFDWSMITCGYNSITRELLYEIKDDKYTLSQLKSMYKHYWKKERKELT